MCLYVTQLLVANKYNINNQARLMTVFVDCFQSSLKNRGTVGGYFLAGRSMNFVLVSVHTESVDASQWKCMNGNVRCASLWPNHEMPF